MRYLSSGVRKNSRRRGMILLVVMAMLALFAAVGIGMVTYAESEAQAAKLRLGSIVVEQPDVDTELLMAYFLNQLIYPTDNIYSAMRGHDLARSMYGYNPSVLNYTPFNGVGRQSLAYTDAVLGAENYNLINYQRFFDPAAPANPTLNFERRPEYYGKIVGGVPSADFRYVGGANPPWTSYDTNNMYLAQVTAAGEVLMPSFYRPWNTNTPVPAAAEKYRTLRPHTSWHTSFATPDSDAGGDVKNRDRGPGTLVGPGAYANNDSIWMDLGFPIMTAPNGRKYKALFAPLIEDLSNRLHLWAHGGRVVPGGASVSNIGFGPPEVNLSKGLTLSTDPAAVVAQKAAELQSLKNLIYGGPSGTAGNLASNLPAGTPTGFRPTLNYPYYSFIDTNGFDSVTGISTNPFYTSFVTSAATGVPAAPSNMKTGATHGGTRWAIQMGMPLLITDAGGTSETVIVTGVDPKNQTFSANFTMAHGIGAEVSYRKYFPFPTYPGSGWNNANALEMTNNPLWLNLLNPVAPNIGPLAMSNQEHLHRFGGTNAPALHSEIFRRMPVTFSSMRTRNMVTLTNWHLDRVTSSPYIQFDPNTAGNYQYSAAAGYPRLPAVPPVPPYGVPGTFSANSEYTPDWRSNLGAMLRVNLNRPLADYPLPSIAPNAAEPASMIIDTTPGSVSRNHFDLALAQRQQFALDIYNALTKVTGAQDPRKVAMLPASTEYLAARWLAQLSVNIVDYIDSDDYITPWNWHGGEVVFGTELPRLVLNEVYAQNDNVNDGVLTNVAAMTASGAKLNLWVELHNPFAASGGRTYPLDNGTAKLQIGANPIYQVVVCRRDDATLATNLRDPGNNSGDPEFNNISGTPYTLNTSSSWGTTAGQHEVLPAGGAASGPSGGNSGYYVVGSDQTLYLPTRDPGLPKTTASAALSIARGPLAPMGKVTVLLRRLANPHLPPQGNAALALYNPYITVDYVDDITAWDNRDFDANGVVPGGAPPIPSTRYSFGRKQPYGAHNPAAPATSQIAGQAVAVAGQPSNTFFVVNTPNDAPFTWLTHLDRPLVNQLELLHVSGYKPHELTQQFIIGANKHRHLTGAWIDTFSPLHRALDVLATPSYMAGMTPGGRLPGNINLNTLTELEIWHALCDPHDSLPLPEHPYPLFTNGDVNLAFARLVASRTPSNTGNHPMQPASDGNPFRSLGDGDVSKSWLRSDASGPIFLPGSLPANAHRYAQTSLLQKIFNNITTTSNVFAVTWTVGYFEVVDETVRPARLGAEIGRDENRHIRHRFFAIVDRSGLQLFNTVATNTTPANPTWNVGTAYAVGNTVNHNGLIYQCVQASTGVSPPNTNFWAPITMSATMNFNPVTGTTANGVPLAIQPGMLLEIDTGASAEVVAVQAVAGNSFTANFTRSHGVGATIVCRGNPGPQTNYNPRRDNNVVLHMSVIK